MKLTHISPRPLAVALLIAFASAARAQKAPAPAVDCRTWISLETGYPLPQSKLIPARATIDPHDPNHAIALPVVPRKGAGTQYLDPARDNYIRQPDGTWVDAATNKPVPSGDLLPLGADRSSYNDKYAHDTTAPDGKEQYFLRPCPDPLPNDTPTPEEPPPPHAPRHPAPPSPISRHDPVFTFGIGIGGLGRTTTYDDDYKIGTTSFTFLVNGSVNFPVSKNWSVGPRAELIFPFNTAVLDHAETKLLTVGSMSGYVGYLLPHRVFDRTPTIYATIGLAIGAERAGADYTDDSYSDTRTMIGFTPSFGVDFPITPRVAAYAKISYLDLPFTTFDSPTGDYKLKETGIGGSIGFIYRFGPVTPPPAP